MTYRNEKAKKFVEPLAKELEASIFMPLDLQTEGHLAARPRCRHRSKEGFLTAMEISCWSFIRMAKLAEPLMKDGGTLSTMTYYGSRWWWRITT
jgi:enoyl-[acyl-carrier protein] reductase I